MRRGPGSPPLVAALLLGWGFLLGGCGTEPAREVELSLPGGGLQAKVRALLDPKVPPRKAISALGEILASHPRNVVVAWALADRASRAGKEKEAARLFAGLPGPFRETALARLESAASPAKALERLKKVLRKRPGFFPALYLQGRILSRLGRWEEAQQALEKCLALAPDWAPALFETARVLAARKRPREAATYLGRYLARRPQDKEARLFRLRLFLSPGGDLSGARRELRRLKREMPQDERVTLMEGALRELEGKPKEAASIYRRLLQTSKNEEVKRIAAFDLGVLLKDKLHDSRGAYRAFQVYLSCPPGKSLADKLDLLRVRTWVLELKEGGAAASRPFGPDRKPGREK